ncbi:MAG: hypothetical protein R3B84_15890 [Zavarzinella sp.]
MKWCLFVGLYCTATLFAQDAQFPRLLPTTVLQPPGPQVITPIAGGKASTTSEPILIEFSSLDLKVLETKGNLELYAGEKFLRSFGNNRTLAQDMLFKLRQTGANQLVRVEGSHPPFELWLNRGKMVQKIAGIHQFLPITTKRVQAQQLLGKWVVTDQTNMLYDFGNAKENALVAAKLFKDHGVNMVTMHGGFPASMVFPMYDKQVLGLQRPTDPDPLSVVQGLTHKRHIVDSDLLLDNKIVIQSKLLDVSQVEGAWMLTHDGVTLGNFGLYRTDALAAKQAIEQSRVTEIVSIGQTGVQLWLVNGTPLRYAPRNAGKIDSFLADRLNVKQLRQSYWLCDDRTPLLDGKSEADAQLLKQVIAAYRLSAICSYGKPGYYGIQLLAKMP